MFKPLTAEGRFEAGIDEIVAGKLWAFVAIVGDPYVIGIAVANEAGYHPVPTHWCYGDDFFEMQKHANDLNRAEGLDVEAEARIVASSMAQGKIKQDHSTLFDDRGPIGHVGKNSLPKSHRAEGNNFID